MNLKSLGKNTILYAFSSLCLRTVAFLLTPFFTRYLSMSQFGLLSTLLLTVQALSVVMSLGMRSGFLRYTKNYECAGKIGTLVGTSTLITLGGGIAFTIACVGGLEPFFRSVMHSDNISGLLIATCLVALSQTLCFHLSSYYRAGNKALRFFFVSAGTAISLMLTNIVCVLVFDVGIMGILVSQAITYFAAFVVISIDILPGTGFGFATSTVKELLRFSLPSCFANSGQFIMGGATIYFVSYFGGLESAAIYALGYKLAQIAEFGLIMPFQLANEAFIYTNIQEPGIRSKISRSLTYFVLIYTFAAMSILLFVKLLFPLIAPPQYYEAYLVVILMLPAFLFKASAYFGETLLGAVHKTHVSGMLFSACSLLSLAMNYFLVPAMGWPGAVITSNFCYAVMGLTALLIGAKMIRIQFEIKRLSSILGAFVSFLVLFFLVRQLGGILIVFVSVCAFALSISLILRTEFFDRQERLLIGEQLRKVNHYFS
jgi:O-antigen/teichoic acid export membrane protein